MKKKETVGAENLLPEQIAGELVTVILKRQHTHAGQVHVAGETLQVKEAMVRWLINHGVVNR